jgi:inner membrane protein
LDPLAHGLAGALMARAQPSRSKGLLLACVLGALIPDIDIAMTFFGHEFYTFEHRGFTHSFLGLLPMSLLAAGVAQLFMKRRGHMTHFPLLLLMAFLGVLSHLYLDLCTSWGIMLLWPNKTRFALDQLFIVDPWYWGLFAIPLLLSFLRPQDHKLISRLGLVVIMAYHGLCVFDHRQALRIVEEDKPKAWRAAFPQPLSPLRWSVFERGDGVLRNAKVDLWVKLKPLEWKEWKEPARTPAVQAAMDSPLGMKYLWFARVPMWEEAQAADGTTLVTFWDMRFNIYFMEDRVSRRFGATFKVKDGKVLDSWL